MMIRHVEKEESGTVNIVKLYTILITRLYNYFKIVNFRIIVYCLA